MSLIDLYNAAINDTLLTLPTLQSHFGRQWLTAEEGTFDVNTMTQVPRIIWVPSGTNVYSAPVGGGGDRISNPRPLWTCQMEVDIHCWASNLDANGGEISPGANYAACEALRIIHIQSIHRTIRSNNYTMKISKWVDQKGSQIQHGGLYVMTATFEIPIPRVTDPTAVINVFPTTYQIVIPPGAPETGGVSP